MYRQRARAGRRAGPGLGLGLRRPGRPAGGPSPPCQAGSTALLSAVTAGRRGGAWAVGQVFAAGAPAPLIEHWNGRAWHRVALRRGLVRPGVLSGADLDGIVLGRQAAALVALPDT